MSPLVSVVVVTYNSYLFIVETLESVLNQSWKEIELIITDDCSEDDTVELCRSWLKKNEKRFDRFEIITSEKNTGVPANANRGLTASKGKWISFLAGDDTMKPDCIKDNMLWLSSNPDIKVLFSIIEVYKNTFEPQNLIGKTPHEPYNPRGIMAHGRDSDSQYRMLLISDRIHFTPSLFIHRETLLSLGGFDERYKLLEDYPLWLNLTKNGYKLYFLDKVTVNYRRHIKAINNTGKNYLVNPNYFLHEDFRKVYTYPYMPVDMRLNLRFNWYVSHIFRLSWFNRNQKPNRFLLALLTIYLNPFKYFIWFRKRLTKSMNDNEFYI